MNITRHRIRKQGGFTLVELIVVLVILAILAAILVPTLIGYIDQANSSKNYATAQSVREAARAVADEMYADKDTGSTTKNYLLDMRKSKKQYVDKVFELAGVSRDDPHGVQDFRFLYSNSDGSDVIRDGSDKIHESWAQSYNYVVIDGTRYTLKPDGTWSTKKESSPRP